VSLAAYALTDVQSCLDTLSTSSTPNPGLIEDLINSASRQMITYSRREFKPLDAAALVRTFQLTPARSAYFAPSEPTSVSLVRVSLDGAFTTVSSTDYQLFRYDPSGVTGGYSRISLLTPGAGSWAYSRGEPLLEVTGVWGFAAVPADVKAACEFQVAQWFRRNYQARSNILADDTGEAAISPHVELSYSVKRFLDQSYAVNVYV
jgi:hypothetical protein